MKKQTERVAGALIIIATLVLSVIAFTVWLRGSPSFSGPGPGAPLGGFIALVLVWSLPLSWIGGALISYAIVKPDEILRRHLLFLSSTTVLAVVLPYPVSWAIKASLFIG